MAIDYEKVTEDLNREYEISKKRNEFIKGLRDAATKDDSNIDLKKKADDWENVENSKIEIESEDLKK